MLTAVMVSICHIKCASATDMVSGTINYDYAYEVLRLVNIERANAGLEPLTMDAVLIDVANVRSPEIIVKFSHTRPDGSSCFTAFVNRGDASAYGENIAAGHRTPEDVVNDWMNSEGHRANILNAKFTRIGISCVYVENSYYGYYWTQFFANGTANEVYRSGTQDISIDLSTGASTVNGGQLPQQTQAATQPPTQAPTEAQTKTPAATQPPTKEQTVAPTEKETQSSANTQEQTKNPDSSANATSADGNTGISTINIMVITINDIPISGVKLNKGEVYENIGVMCVPSQEESVGYTFASSDENVIRFEGNSMKVIGFGKTTLTVKASNGVVRTYDIEVPEVNEENTTKKVSEKSSLDKQHTTGSKNAENSLKQTDNNGKNSSDKQGKLFSLSTILIIGGCAVLGILAICLIILLILFKRRNREKNNY